MVRSLADWGISIDCPQGATILCAAKASVVGSFHTFNGPFFFRGSSMRCSDDLCSESFVEEVPSMKFWL